MIDVAQESPPVWPWPGSTGYPKVGDRVKAEGFMEVHCQLRALLNASVLYGVTPRLLRVANS